MRMNISFSHTVKRSACRYFRSPAISSLRRTAISRPFKRPIVWHRPCTKTRGQQSEGSEETLLSAIIEAIEEIRADIKASGERTRAAIKASGERTRASLQTVTKDINRQGQAHREQCLTMTGHHHAPPCTTIHHHAPPIKQCSSSDALFERSTTSSRTCRCTLSRGGWRKPI